jgi:WD40 repeat protein
VWVADPATGRTLATLSGHEGYIPGASVSPDGAWLATLDMHGVVRVWQTSTWQLRAATRVDDLEPEGGAWFADGTGISVTGNQTAFLLAFTPGGRPT